jgi:hypothetical protein
MDVTRRMLLRLDSLRAKGDGSGVPVMVRPAGALP